MITLLPITTPSYDPLKNPNQINIYIDIDNRTAKKLHMESPGFYDVTSLSSRSFLRKDVSL